MSGLVGELAQSELFRGVPEEILQRVASAGEPMHLKAGEVLLSPERSNQHVYLLLSGALAVHFGSPDSPEIRELSVGFSVGEISVINGNPPSAYVVAKRDSRVFPISFELVNELTGGPGTLAHNMLRMLTGWIRTNTERIVQDYAQIVQLTNHANIDELTGLYNRRWLDRAFQRLLDKAQPMCVLLADVDHFKPYNDTHGHIAGDQALVALANALRASVRPYDFVARYGGEEFLVLLPYTTLREGEGVAEQIRANVEKCHVEMPDGQRLPGITMSIGMALCLEDMTPEAALHAADVQLYQAKLAGRNRVCVEL